jgi:hypothetical protein
VQIMTGKGRHSHCKKLINNRRQEHPEALREAMVRNARLACDSQ